MMIIGGEAISRLYVYVYLYLERKAYFFQLPKPSTPNCAVAIYNFPGPDRWRQRFLSPRVIRRRHRARQP